MIGLRHERDRHAALLRERLDAGLVDHVVVGGLQRVRVTEVDLVLARPRLAFGGLDAHAGGGHRVADLAHELFVVAGGEDVVVEDVGHRRREVLVAERVRLLVALAVEEELELGAEHGLEAERAATVDLRLQHLARRRCDRRPVVPLDVAEDERGRLVPGHAAQRPEVWLEPEVAVASLPARHRVAGDGIHLHLEREQVVAAFDLVARVQFLEEELGVQPLAHQPSLHVGEGRDHRVDRARLDVRPQLLQGQHAATISQPESSTA